MHVAREFQEAWPEIERKWYTESNTIVLLSVNDETSLRNLVSKAKELGIKTASFREPDYKDALTAIALEPCEQTASLCQGLSLALRNKHDAHGVDPRVSPNCPDSLVLKATGSNPVIGGENPSQGAKPSGIWRWLKQVFC